jgi:L-iditol 2-dehydrogenase
MKSIALTGIRKIALREIPAPELLSDQEILLKIAVVGVCGSDIHYYKEGHIGDQIVKYPFVAGHECSAIVQQVGKKVTRVKPGDRVAVDPAIACLQCDQCQAKNYNRCRNQRFLGCPGQLEGCLCDYIVMPEANCFKIGNSMSLIHAALVEPLSIGIYAAELLSNKAAQTIGILGTGPIGLSVLLAVKHTGISTIYATDKIEDRLQIARKVGAFWTGNPDEVDVVELIQPNSLDAVLECCGDQQALDQAIALLKPGGELLILGIPETNRISFDVHKLRRKEISILNVRRQNLCTQRAIDLIENKQIDIDFMATHHFHLENTQQAFEIVAGYKDGVVKAMIIL